MIEDNIKKINFEDDNLDMILNPRQSSCPNHKSNSLSSMIFCSFLYLQNCSIPTSILFQNYLTLLLARLASLFLVVGEEQKQILKVCCSEEEESCPL